MDGNELLSRGPRQRLVKEPVTVLPIPFTLYPLFWLRRVERILKEERAGKIDLSMTF